MEHHSLLSKIAYKCSFGLRSNHPATPSCPLPGGIVILEETEHSHRDRNVSSKDKTADSIKWINNFVLICRNPTLSGAQVESSLCQQNARRSITELPSVQSYRNAWLQALKNSSARRFMCNIWVNQEPFADLWYKSGSESVSACQRDVGLCAWNVSSVEKLYLHRVDYSGKIEVIHQGQARTRFPLCFPVSVFTLWPMRGKTHFPRGHKHRLDAFG